MSVQLMIVALPCGEWTTRPQLSLYFTMNIDAPGMAVKDLRVVDDWPLMVEQLSFTAFSRHASGSKRVGTIRLKPGPSGSQAKDLWDRLMPRDAHFATAQFGVAATRKKLLTYDFRYICDQIQAFYDQPLGLRLSNHLEGVEWWGEKELLAQHAQLDKQFQPSKRPKSESEAEVRRRKFYEFARRHMPDDSPIEMPLTALQAVEFHEQLSQIAATPPLMRKTRFILDAEIVMDDPADQFLGGTLAVMADNPQALGSGTDVLSSWTVFNTRAANGRRFAYIAAAQRDPNRRRGFFLFNPSELRLVQSEPTITAQNYSLYAQSRRQARAAGKFWREEKPARHSAGFFLMHTAIDREADEYPEREDTIAEMAGNSSSGLPDQNAPPLMVWNLDRGYRVDVWWSRTQSWHPLCGRNLTLVEADRETPLPVTSDSEGFVALSLTSAAGQQQATSQQLFNWNGWSLVVPRPERAFGDKEDLQDAPPLQTAWQVRENVEPGTLPPLRFGDEYKFRARTVDLAGNSWTFDGAEALSTELQFCETKLERFERLDPVAPPVAMAKTMSKGEKVTLLAITTGATASTGKSQRFVVAPRGNYTLCDRHGLIDQVSSQEAFDVFALSSEAAKKSAKPEDLPIDGRYVADPMAEALIGIVEGAPGIDPIEIKRQPFAPGLIKTPNQAIHIELTGGKNRVKQSKARLQFRLAPGQSRRLMLSSLPSAQLTAHVAQSLKNSDGSLTPAAHPAAAILLVHAVEAPLRAPQIDAAETEITLPRQRNDTFVDFDPALDVDIDSTGRVTHQARWNEYVDNPENPDWTIVPRGAPFAARDIALPVGHPMEAASDLTLGSHVSLAERMAFAAQFVSENDESTQTRFDFGDPNDRLLIVTPIGHSRFTEFFDTPAPAPQPSAAPQTPVSETPNTRVGQERLVRILSTANPNLPDIDYVLPAFTRTERREFRNIRHSDFRGGAFRIYLQRTWRYSEKLALIFAPQGSATSFTTIANDPIVQSAVDFQPLSPTDFESPTETRVYGKQLPIGDDNKLSGAARAAIRRETATVVDFVWADVHFHAGKNLRYADFRLTSFRHAQAYKPFMRLALARYNPHSIDGAELSPVAMLDWIQPAPDRHVVVRRVGPDQYKVTVTASAADVTNGTTRNRFVAHSEYSEFHSGDEYAWSHVSGSNVELTLRSAVPGDYVWDAIVKTHNWTLLGARRIVIQEFFGSQAPGCAPETADVLVYFDVIEI